MSEPRQYAAVRQAPLRAGNMAIGEFCGAPAASGDNGPMYAAPAYWFYEMSQAALNPSRAFAGAALLSQSGQPLVVYRLRQDHGREPGTVRALDPPLRQAGVEHQFDRGRRRAGPGAYLHRLAAAVLPASAFRARLRTRAP